MISLIGIGDFCCQIVDKLSKHPQYVVYRISSNIEDGERSKKIQKLKTAEEYEKKVEIRDFINDKSKTVSVFVDGSEAVSGIILKLLQTVSDKKITVFYIQSDLSLNSPTEKLQNKVAINVLQQYARSGLFEKIIMLDKHMIESIIGEVSLKEYDDKISEYISNVVHMINVYSNIKPIMSNSSEVQDASRITTYGIGLINNEKINWFYDLKHKENITYYFAINKTILEKDKKLLQNIKKQIRSLQTEQTQVNFNIFETSYQENYVFCVAATKFIQTETTA